ncbi:MAG: hypothetical protein HZA31_07195 [Opitutae bacterium]|nr:hypothetical protein [Opitutae bacterium]
MKRIGKKRPQSVLGLTLEGGRLRACHVRRVKGRLETGKAIAEPLALDLSRQEPELLGAEIKNLLNAAGLRERRCVAAVPAGWVMSLHTKLPDLPPEDLESFLQLETERGFPCDSAQLQIARSFHRTATSAYVMQLAVRKEQLERLAEVMKAAGLKPESFTLGLTALPGVLAAEGKGGVTVAVDPAGATLLFAAGGGIAAFRSFEAVVEAEAGARLVNHAAVARELRITLEQVPAELRSELHGLRLLGDEPMVRQMEECLAGWARGTGLTLEAGGTPEGRMADAVAEYLARGWLESDAGALNFLPPRQSQWHRLIARYNAKRLGTIGAALGAAAVIALGAFVWQEFRLWSLRSTWSDMKPQVTELEAVQARVREYRSWYDTSYRYLSVLRLVTNAFPDNGSVTAKTFEIRNMSVVSVSGVTRDNAALLKTLNQLRQTREVTGLKVEQIRGKSPSQFTFNFRWNGNTSP